MVVAVEGDVVADSSGFEVVATVRAEEVVKAGAGVAGASVESEKSVQAGKRDSVLTGKGKKSATTMGMREGEGQACRRAERD